MYLRLRPLPPNGQNVMHWCNPVAEAAMTEFKLTYDLTEQKRDDDVVQEELVRDAPTFVMAIAGGHLPLQHRPQGVPPEPVSMFDDMMNVDI